MTCSPSSQTVQTRPCASTTTWFEAVVDTLEEGGWRYFTGRGLEGGGPNRSIVEPYQSVIVDALRRHDDPPPPELAYPEQMSVRRWRYWNCTALSEQSWADAARGERTQLLGESCEALVDAVLPMLTEAPPVLSMADMLTAPDPAGDRAVGVQEAVLAAWWADRLDEGQSETSARFLLGLTLPPRLAALVRYDADGPHLSPRFEPFNQLG